MKMLATMLVVLAIALTVDYYRGKALYYEKALASIAVDMQINYGLQQGTLEALRDCRDTSTLAGH